MAELAAVHSLEHKLVLLIEDSEVSVHGSADAVFLAKLTKAIRLMGLGVVMSATPSTRKAGRRKLRKLRMKPPLRRRELASVGERRRRGVVVRFPGCRAHD